MSNDHATNDTVHFRNILYTLMGVSLFIHVYLQSVVYCHHGTKLFLIFNALKYHGSI